MKTIFLLLALLAAMAATGCRNVNATSATIIPVPSSGAGSSGGGL